MLGPGTPLSPIANWLWHKCMNVLQERDFPRLLSARSSTNFIHHRRVPFLGFRRFREVVVSQCFVFGLSFPANGQPEEGSKMLARLWHRKVFLLRFLRASPKNVHVDVDVDDDDPRCTCSKYGKHIYLALAARFLALVKLRMKRTRNGNVPKECRFSFGFP